MNSPNETFGPLTLQETFKVFRKAKNNHCSYQNFAIAMKKKKFKNIYGLWFV